MNHVKAIGFKFVFISVVLYSLLAIFETATLTGIFITSITVTILSYVIGDLFILPRFNNVIASLADFGFIFATVWILSSAFIYSGSPIGIVSGFAAFFITIGEVFFHVHMKEKVLKAVEGDNEVYQLHPARLQTEFAEDQDVDYIRKKQEEKE